MATRTGPSRVCRVCHFAVRSSLTTWMMSIWSTEEEEEEEEESGGAEFWNHRFVFHESFVNICNNMWLETVTPNA